MDPNQIIGAGVDAYNALDADSKHALTYPSAKTLGNATDGLISLICYPLLGENESLGLNKCCLKINSFGRSLCHCIFE